MQTTLLGLAIAFILALAAALIGPYFIDWNQFRPQFEAEASQIVGAPVRVAGELDARLLPAPTLRLHLVTIGGANDLGKIRADKLDVEFSLSDLMRGQWRANQLNVAGLALDLGLNQQGRVDWPAWNGSFNFASLAIDRLNLTGRIALHDAASRSTLELNDIAFSGDVRSLAGAVRGDGNFTIGDTRYPFRISSGQNPDGNSTRVHLNIDPAERPLAIDLEGQLSFDARAPKFEGALVLARPPPKKGAENAPAPWRITSKVKADHASAQFEQLEASYGVDDRALKLVGLGDVRFGATPQLRASLSARQLDADRLLGSDQEKGGAGPRLLSALHALLSELPQVPIRTRIESSVEQIMLSGRPLQNVSLALRHDSSTWAIDRLDLRAPGTTQISFTSNQSPATPADSFAGTLNIDSAESDTLTAWLQGRTDVARRAPKPLRLVGDVVAGRDHFAITGLNADIDGGAIEGSVSLSAPRPPKGARLEAALKAERLDLDVAAGFVKSLAGPDANWPDEASVALDVGRAISSGQELKPFSARFGYDSKDIVLDRIKIGQPNQVTLEGSGRFDRANATGRLALDATSPSMTQLAAIVGPLSPQMSARLTAAATVAGPVALKLALDVTNADKAASGHPTVNARLEFNAPQLKGLVTANAAPRAAAVRALDLDALGRTEVSVNTNLSSERSGALLALLGLDKAVAAGDGALQFEGSASGVWRQPLQLKAKLSGNGIDAEAQGTAEPWAASPKANVDLRIRSVNLAPLFGLKPADTIAQNIRLFARASLADDKLSFDNIDSVAAGSRLRGHLAMTMGEERAVDGDLGLDSLDLAPSFALAIGASGQDSADPLGAGLIKGWRGRVNFQALRGVLPGGAELLPVSGAIRGDGQSLTIEGLKGKIGGGDVSGTIDARPDPNGIVINSRLDLSGVDATALRYRGLKMPSGRASLQMSLMSRGRSVAALADALSGSGTMTVQSASLPGLDPRAFDVAIRAGDAGQVLDDARLKQIVGVALASGNLPVATAQIPFNIRDGRLRIDATTLEAQNARVLVSGGYDMLADQADLRVSLSANAIGSATSRPEIQIFATGTPDALNPMLDVTSLSSWLAVRTIDRETRRLDAIERGEAPPVEPTPSTAALPLPAPPETAKPGPVPPDLPLPGRDPRRAPPRPVTVAPRPVVPPSAAPTLSQRQVAPLPPPVEIRPAPGPAPVAPRPRPRPPLVLTPQGQP